MRTATSYLINGATGFVGSRLVERLSREGAIVYCLAQDERDQRSRLPKLPGVVPIEVPAIPSSIRGFLSDVQPEVVVNLAAAGVAPASRVPVTTLVDNVSLVGQLLEGLGDSPPRVFLHAGSWSEYGASKHGQRIHESHPINPETVYGSAKASASMFGSAYARALSIHFVTLRFFNVYGVGEADHRLIPYLVERLREQMPADLTSGDQVRDLTYVDDVVEAIVCASTTELVGFTAYNICSSREIRIRSVAEMVADSMTVPKELLRFGALPDRVGEASWVVGDNTLFREATGWEPRTSIVDGVRQTVAWSIDRGDR